VPVSGQAVAAPKPTKTAALVNDGHGIRFEKKGFSLGFLKVNAMEYQAESYVFRSPSEHTIDGAVFPLEIQVLHLPPHE